MHGDAHLLSILQIWTALIFIETIPNIILDSRDSAVSPDQKTAVHERGSGDPHCSSHGQTEAAQCFVSPMTLKSPHPSQC